MIQFISHYIQNSIVLNSSASYFYAIRYTEFKISSSLSYVTVRGEGKMEMVRGEQDALCTIVSPLSTYLGWLATNVKLGDILRQV
jgi:hypothetical protein